MERFPEYNREIYKLINHYAETNQKNVKTVKVRTEPKIQRNQPCICGSNLKYKKCCGSSKQKQTR
jgi:uncharacterized protein YchJ